MFKMNRDQNRKPNRNKKALVLSLAVLAVGGVSVGGSMAGWVDDAKVITPIASSSLDFRINNVETDTLAPTNENAFTQGIAPGEYASSQFTPMVSSSNNTSMKIDVTLVVTGVATAVPGLSYAIAPNGLLPASYGTLVFRPLVNGTVLGDEWLSGSGAPDFLNITPDTFNAQVSGAPGGKFKILFKADNALVEGTSATPEFRFVATQLAQS